MNEEIWLPRMLWGNKTTGVIWNLGNPLTLLVPKVELTQPGVWISIESAGISVPAIEWTQVQMFLRRVARSEAGTQEAGARQWPQETAPPHSSRAREGGKMETRMPQCKPLTSDVKLIGQPWLHWTMCSPFYLDKWSEALVAQSCLALCEPADCILPVSSARGISQARISSGLPFSSPGNLPDPGVKPRSPTLQADSLLSEPQGEQYAFIKTI